MATTANTESKQAAGDGVVTATPPIISFLSEVSSSREIQDVRSQLDAFILEQTGTGLLGDRTTTTTYSHRRPVALVTSGGTAAPLEINSVRVLDNFSTGWRGAVAVEEFLKRGYAVIHLWRQGSASPFARVVSEALGLKQANHGLSVDSVARLFAVDVEEADELIQQVLQQEGQQQQQHDPFLTEPTTTLFQNGTTSNSARANFRRGSRNAVGGEQDSDEIVLNRAIVHSTRIHKALRERSAAVEENRLLTIPFETIEDYLAKLELASCAIQDCQSLAVIFLAAAVSDFYIPRSKRAQHKIQSHGGKEELVLTLYPVPKVLGILRSIWAPDAFVVSFKLETDHAILRHKAEKAVQSYGVHLVVGNLLQSRHERVWIFGPDQQREKHPNNAAKWNMEELVQPAQSASFSTSWSEQHSLESSILDFVVQSHFEFISWHFNSTGKKGIEIAKRNHRALMERKRKFQRERLWKQVQNTIMDYSGFILSSLIGIVVNGAIQRWHSQRQ